jgi:RNA polymerase sigma-70 factor, ECF subfamily
LQDSCQADKHLAARAARGDQQAFTLLVERYRRLIYSLAYRVVLNQEDALDVTQNVYLRLVQRIGTYDGRGNFRAWLATITTRMAIDYLRRKTPDAFGVDDIEFLADDADCPLKTFEEKERHDRVEAAMALLSPQQRAIVTLRLGEDMGPKEIAERLELPPGQVRSQTNRAVKRIREKIVIEKSTE